MTFLRGLLLAGTAVGVAACGADDVASPGEGTLVVIQQPSPTPPPPPPPTTTPPTTSGPAASCPTGFINAGLVSVNNDTSNQLRNCQITGTISGNLVVSDVDGVIYSLSGGVRVGVDTGADGTATGGDAAVLTIEPGVVLFGESGADFLLVNRGSRVIAEGTETAPIILTSRSNVEGTAGANTIGEWGGVVVLGQAPIAVCPGGTPGQIDCESQIEGVTNALFGGLTPNDNSGRWRFLQVRYPGFEVTQGNELNGISLGGVGSGTVFDHIQVHNSSDDGIEWFGGRIDGSFLALTGIDDDSLDVDEGYQGSAQFVLVQQRAAGGDKMIEGDSNGNEDLLPRTNFVVANATFIGSNTSSGDEGLQLRGGMDFTLANSVLTNTSGPCVNLDSQVTVRAADAALEDNGPPVFASVLFDCDGGAADVDSGGVTEAEIDAIIAADANNTEATNTLANGLFPGATENGVTAATLSTIDSALVDTTYIGAFENDQDTWFAGWTCGIGGGTACETPPVPASSAN